MSNKKDGRRYSPLKPRYKKVKVSRKHREAILNAADKSPEDWGPERLVVAVQRYNRITVTADEVWTVLNS